MYNKEFLQIGISSRYIACDIAEIVHAGYTNRTAILVLQKKHHVYNTKNLREIKQLIEKFPSPIKISFFLGKKIIRAFYFDSRKKSVSCNTLYRCLYSGVWISEIHTTCMSQKDITHASPFRSARFFTYLIHGIIPIRKNSLILLGISMYVFID